MLRIFSTERRKQKTGKLGTIHPGIFGVRIASILPFWKRNGETNKVRRSIDPRGPSDFGHPRSFRASKQAFRVFRDSTGIFGTRFTEIQPLDLRLVCSIGL